MFLEKIDLFEINSMLSSLYIAYLIYTCILDCAYLGAHSTIRFPLITIYQQCLTTHYVQSLVNKKNVKSCGMFLADKWK